MKFLSYAVRRQLGQSGQTRPAQRCVRPQVDDAAVVEGAEDHAEVEDAAMALVARRRGQRGVHGGGDGAHRALQPPGPRGVGRPAGLTLTLTLTLKSL